MKKTVKDKRGLSEMIGYILLVAMTIALSVIAYSWLRTYVPQEKLECPSDVSILIKNLEIQNENLNLVVSNNGLFSIAGIIAKYGLDENQLATKDLYKGFSGGRIFISNLNAPIKQEEKQDQNNEFENGEEIKLTITLPEDGIKIVELTPIMYVLDEKTNKMKLAVCGNSKARERV